MILLFSAVGGFLLFISTMFGLFSLSQLTSVLLITQGLNAIARLIRAFGHRIDNITIKRPSTGTVQADKSERLFISDIIKQGERILNVLDLGNSCYGQLVYYECGLTLFLSIMALYWILSCIISATIVGFSEFYMSSGLGSSIIFIVSMYRLAFVVRHVQHIQEEIDNVVKVTRSKLGQHYGDMTGEERFGLMMMKENFEDSTGISPQKTFTLNHAMVLSALSTLLTYLIVLMQFKSSDTSS